MEACTKDGEGDSDCDEGDDKAHPCHDVGDPADGKRKPKSTKLPAAIFDHPYMSAIATFVEQGAIKEEHAESEELDQNLEKPVKPESLAKCDKQADKLAAEDVSHEAHCLAKDDELVGALVADGIHKPISLMHHLAAYWSTDTAGRAQSDNGSNNDMAC